MFSSVMTINSDVAEKLSDVMSYNVYSTASTKNSFLQLSVILQIFTTFSMALSSWQILSSSFNDCRRANWPLTITPSQLTWVVRPLRDSYHLHPLSSFPFLKITLILSLHGGEKAE